MAGAGGRGAAGSEGGSLIGTSGGSVGVGKSGHCSGPCNRLWLYEDLMDIGQGLR